MKKKYKFRYASEYTIMFIVDLELFTKEKAKEFLEFYLWDKPIDSDKNIIIEALEKIAIKCFATACFLDTYSCYFISKEIENNTEAYPLLNGSSGIELDWVEYPTINEYEIKLEEITNYND